MQNDHPALLSESETTFNLYLSVYVYFSVCVSVCLRICLLLCLPCPRPTVHIPAGHPVETFPTVLIPNTLHVHFNSDMLASLNIHRRFLVRGVSQGCKSTAVPATSGYAGDYTPQYTLRGVSSGVVIGYRAGRICRRNFQLGTLCNK